MSIEETVRKLLEGAQQGTLPLIDEEAPTIDLDTATEWEINAAIEAAVRLADANHLPFIPSPGGDHPVPSRSAHHVESNDRPKLAEALGRCLLHTAVLVIAKLDRLSRAARTALNSNTVERK
jgi:hypothetical protein